jgi:hypothetical protein
MSNTFRILCCAFLLSAPLDFFSLAQTTPNSQTGSPLTNSPAQLAHNVPVMDGGAGPCSIELTALSADAKPVYGATIKVHMAFGFGGFHRLDLEASTNVDGKVNFVGIPSRVHRPPLLFRAAKNQLVGTVQYDPDTECHAKHDIMLDMPKAPPNK